MGTDQPFLAGFCLRNASAVTSLWRDEPARQAEAPGEEVFSGPSRSGWVRLGRTWSHQKSQWIAPNQSGLKQSRRLRDRCSEGAAGRSELVRVNPSPSDHLLYCGCVQICPLLRLTAAVKA